MNRFNVFKRGAWLVLVMFTLAFALGACEGDDGANGQDGVDGADGVDGQDGLDAGSDPIAAAKLESCATCHGDVGTDGHQALYDMYTDGSADAGTNLTLAFTGFTSVAAATGFDVTLTIEITQNGLPLVNINNLAMANRFYVTRYDGAGQYFDGNQRIRTVAPTGTPGEFIVSGNIVFDPSAVDSQFFGYVGDEQVIIGDVNYAAHMGLYNNLASAALATGSAQAGAPGAYASLANVEGCETCHGTPYMKHGNRVPRVAGLPDFAACKSCHYDDRTGGHEDWQYMVDEPFNWATDVPSTADYSYTANIMNDVHMSHAMEFPYPQSMANCATCHAGKLDQIITDANFTAETCMSCHPVQGIDAWPEDAGTTLEGMYAQPHRAPPLQFLWTRAGMDQPFHNATANCVSCHSDPDGPPGTGFASRFEVHHSGYDPRISDDTGQRYADTYTVSIDQVTLAGNLLTVNFSSSDPTIAPELLISLYGYDSKQFLIASHSRDGSDLCPSSRGDGCRMEFEPGDTSPLFTEDAASVPGDWMVTLDMAAYVPTTFLPDDIPTLIANGDIKMAEITVTPEFELDDVELGLNAVTQSFDLGGSVLVDDYFKGANATVDTAKCNVCHDQLAVTFHGGSGRGGDIVACKNCHVPTSPGSHLEMASRSIESYVHAIHSFQPFDLDDVAAADDPVENARTALHMEHTFPNFTITNCEACHVAGTFNVPDQAQSMPGVLRASWDIADRNIGNVPEAVTGPASRACGACHRVEWINEDLAGDLASFNAHTESFGTYVENDDEDTVLYGVIDKIMSLFQ